HYFDSSAAIVEHQRDAVSTPAQFEYQASDGDIAPGLPSAALSCPNRPTVREIPQASAGEETQFRLVLRDRVTSEVQTECVSFASKARGFWPFRQLDLAGRIRSRTRGQPEQIVLTHGLRAGGLLAHVHCRAEAAHQRIARVSEGIKAAGADQRFQHTLVHAIEVKPSAHVLDAREWSACAA